MPRCGRRSGSLDLNNPAEGLDLNSQAEELQEVGQPIWHDRVYAKVPSGYLFPYPGVHERRAVGASTMALAPYNPTACNPAGALACWGSAPLSPAGPPHLEPGAQVGRSGSARDHSLIA